MIQLLEFTCPVVVEETEISWHLTVGPPYIKVSSNFAEPMYMGFTIQFADLVHPGVVPIAPLIMVSGPPLKGKITVGGVEAPVQPGEVAEGDRWVYVSGYDDFVRTIYINKGTAGWTPTHIYLQVGASTWAAETMWPVERYAGVLDLFREIAAAPPPDVLEFTCPVRIEEVYAYPLHFWRAWCGPLYIKIKSNFTHAKYMRFRIRAAAKLNGEFALGTYIAGHFKVCAEGFIGCLPGEGIAAVLPGEEVVKSQWDYESAAPDPDLRISVISQAAPTHLCLQIFASDAFAGPYVGVLEQYWEIAAAPPGIQLAAGANYVAYGWGAPGVTLADALAPIWDYYMGSYVWDREARSWTSGALTHVMAPGEHLAITVSQACTLENFRWWVIHINEVVVPSGAVAGATVPVEVKMYNYRPEAIIFDCTGGADGATFGSAGHVVCPGAATVSLFGSFTMPNKDVTLTIWAFYQVGSEWVLDDWREVTIQVEEEVTYAFTVGSPGVSAA